MAGTRAIYAGVLIKAESVEVTFAERPYKAQQTFGEDNFNYQAAANLPDMVWPIVKGGARRAVTAAAEHIVHKCPEVRAIGVATFGPLMSLTPGDPNYGRVSPSSVHASLKGLPVFKYVDGIANSQKRKEDGFDTINVRVHTDVMCGAVFEKWLRSSEGVGGRKYWKLAKDEGLVFVNLTSSIGGAYVVRARPFKSGLQPEIALLPLGTRPNDPLAPSDPVAGTAGQRVWLDDVATSTAMRRRADGRPIDSIEPNHEAWDFQVEYTAKLCAALTVMLTPHQIVLHGPVVDDAQPDVDFINRVREEFPRWIERLPEYPARVEETFIDVALAQNPMLSGSVLLGGLKAHDEEKMLLNDRREIDETDE